MGRLTHFSAYASDVMPGCSRERCSSESSTSAGRKNRKQQQQRCSAAAVLISRNLYCYVTFCAFVVMCAAELEVLSL